MALFSTRLTAARRGAGAALVAGIVAIGLSVAAAPPAQAQRHHFGGHGFAGRGFGGHGFHRGPFFRPGFAVGFGYYGWPYYPAYYGNPYYAAYPYPYPYPSPYPYPYPYPVRTAFYAPPPAQRATIAPQTRHFTVYFQFDRYDLTASARDVIDAAVTAIRAGGPARIQVVGNTDLAGTGPYNRVLSRHRADTVRNYMIAHGIDAGMIEVSALGKTDPAVQTADGTREPRNRRVEIVIHSLGGNAPPATSMRRPYRYGGPYSPANATMAPPPYGNMPPNGAEPAGPPTNLVNP
jgi:outer membrane protein OmpA-like peptidoglycan-associated protein